MRKTARPVWPSATPPPAVLPPTDRALSWQLHDVTELPHVRADLRRYAAATGRDDNDLRDQLVLALDEMASNALRHGGGSRVLAAVRLVEGGYLIEVSDGAPAAPPTPAVGRDPSHGGLGLYLIAELASEHGWYVRDDAKIVWALLPRR